MITAHQKNNLSWGTRFVLTVKHDIQKHWFIYLLFLPVIIYYVLFCYQPMYGAQIAFRNYMPRKGIIGSPWVGMKYFNSFFNSMYFGRLLRNTLLISLYGIVFAFPVPIVFAILLNELKSMGFKRIVQTASYMPHFLSLIVVCGMIREFTSSSGLFGHLTAMLGGEPQTLLLYPQNFRAIYILSDIWQGMGWGSIIYLAALTGIDPEYYDAARVDGAGRFRQIWHVTLPGLLPTIVVLFILRCGSIMNVGYEKIILLYNDNIMETADVISSFIYRRGLIDMDYSYSTAVGLFNSVINIVVLVTANMLCRKVSENSLW